MYQLTNYGVEMYQLTNYGVVMCFLEDKVLFIPPFIENIDYKKYLAWLAEGNQPLPADQLPE